MASIDIYVGKTLIKTAIFTINASDVLGLSTMIDYIEKTESNITVKSALSKSGSLGYTIDSKKSIIVNT